MIVRPPSSTRTYTLCPYTPLVRPTVGRVADAVGVLPDQAEFVEQRVGLFRIIDRPGLAVGFVVERRAGQQGVGAGQGGALVEHLVQLRAVDAEREDRKSTRLNSSH